MNSLVRWRRERLTWFDCKSNKKNYDLARTIAVCQRDQWNDFSPLCSVCYYDLKAENNPCNKLLTMTSSKAKSIYVYVVVRGRGSFLRVSVSPKPFLFLLFLVLFPTYREYSYCQKLHAIMEHVRLQ